MDTLKFKIKEKKWETPDACSFVLEHLSDKSLFYKPGQFITLIVTIEGKEHKRSYSLSTVAIKEKYPSITIKKVKDGNISAYLIENLKEGDVIDGHYPAGMFSPDLNSANIKQYFLLAAGSGISPLFSMLKSILHKEPKSSVSLLYSSRDEEHIIYREQLRLLELEYQERLNVIHLLSNPSEDWQGFKGRADKELIKNLISELSLEIEKSFYLCGPADYMLMAENAILESGFDMNQIKKESFNTSIKPETLMEESESLKSVKIFYRKNEYEFQLAKGQSILEGAMDNNIKIPYNCASGVCTACIGTCTEGEVDMGSSVALSDNEKKSGLVLTCIGIPITSRVVIQID